MVLEGFQLVDDFLDTEAKTTEANAKAVEFTRALNKMTDEEAGRTDLGAIARLEQAQQEAEAVLTWYDQEIQTVKDILVNAQSNAFSFSETLNRQKRDVEKMEMLVKEAEELEAIREEQVASLQNRQEGNFHTSWMGLSRPMEKESHIGLLVAAGGFILLGLLALYYIYRVMDVGIPDFLQGFGLRGGARNRRYR